ncbi:MAG TPA: DUF1918 domain-containing protein [Longimicrobiales bacterium]|nr:DUF1918 domain-containing protein [Longimicrobiales bacterium]
MLKTRSDLRADPGDRLVIRGHHVGELERDGEIVEVLGEDGAPPFVVRWEDSGRQTRFYPSSDAYVQRFAKRRKPRPQPAPPAGTTADDVDWEAAVPPRDS